MNIRVGQGFDVHAFSEGRKLILGGVSIDAPKGLLGHSDADVLLHAITDAVLGAVALGDIGCLFPDTDHAFKDADSRVLLRAAMGKVWQAGWRVGNIDCTVIAQTPKIAPYVPQMRANIAADLNVAPEAVSIKGKTTERLGFTGREEGMAAMAVVLMQQTGSCFD